MLPAVYRDMLASVRFPVVVVPADKPFLPHEVARGIVFVMARWSGASRLAFRALCRVLQDVPSPEAVTLYVVDTDWTWSLDFFQALNECPHGYGETFWISGGRLVHKLTNYDETAMATILDYTGSLSAE